MSTQTLKLLPHSVHLTIHSDPIHCYIEVDANLIYNLSITPKLSSLSLFSATDDKFYLEGDLDGLLLIDALSEHGIIFSFTEKKYDEPRSLATCTKVGSLQ